jgi:hypothetical protein
MEIGYISALSALAGSMLGGVASGYFTFLSQREAARAGSRANDKQRRQDLYRDFVIAASKAFADATMHNEPQVAELVELYAIVGRMRIISSPSVVDAAERIMRDTGETYQSPNLSFPELHAAMKSGALDPLRDFAERAREELQSLPPV